MEEGNQDDQTVKDMESAIRGVKGLADTDYQHLIDYYIMAIDDPSISMWGIDGNDYKKYENKHLPFIEVMQAGSMAQFINLGSRGVVYTIEANKRAGYDGVLGFTIETDIHAYNFVEDGACVIMYAYNGLIFRDMMTLVKYLVCQTYRLGKVKPIIDPYTFNRILFDDETFTTSESISSAEKFIQDYLVT